jgi:hypothetical protein
VNPRRGRQRNPRKFLIEYSKLIADIIAVIHSVKSLAFLVLVLVVDVATFTNEGDGINPNAVSPVLYAVCLCVCRISYRPYSFVTFGMKSFLFVIFPVIVLWLSNILRVREATCKCCTLPSAINNKAKAAGVPMKPNSIIRCSINKANWSRHPDHSDEDLEKLFVICLHFLLKVTNG